MASDPAPPSAPPPPDGESGALTFTLKPEDLTAAYRLQNIARLLTVRAAVWEVVSLAAIAGIVFYIAPHASIVVTLGICACAALGGVLFPAAMILWRVPAAARRIYRQQRGLQGEVTFEWDRQGLKGTSSRGQGRYAWSDYVRWRENRRIVLVYQSDALFQMLPKRVLTPETLTALRTYAADAGVEGARSSRP